MSRFIADLAQEGAVSALAAGVSCQKINRNAPTVGGGTAFGWGADRNLPHPVDAKGFGAPTVDENFVTLRLNHSVRRFCLPPPTALADGVRVCAGRRLGRREGGSEVSSVARLPFSGR